MLTSERQTPAGRRVWGRRGIALVLGLLLAASIVTGVEPAGAAAQASELVSVPDPSTGETLGNGKSTEVSVSDDARYVGFVSEATNLVAGDTNGQADVFVHDRQAGTTERVSVPDPATGATEANGRSIDVSIRGDGNLVAFISGASNLVSGDQNQRADVFVADRSTGSVELVSVNAPGVPNGRGNFWDTYLAQHPHISGNGRYVTWSVYKRTFGFPRWARLYLYDRQTGTTELVSVSTSGDTANNFSLSANVSYDGNLVAFTSTATNLAPGNTNVNKSDVFVRDRVAGTTTLVSVDDLGNIGNKTSVMPLSARGYTVTQDNRFVVFRSQATNLVADDTNNTWDIFIHDLQTGDTERISKSTGGFLEPDGQSQVPSISLDGRYVAYQSMAMNLDLADGTDNFWDVYLHDRQTNVTAVVSVNDVGEPANSSFLDDPAISGDGSAIVYHTRADNLDPIDTNGTNDVYLAPTAGATDPEPDMMGTIGLETPLERGTDGEYTVHPTNAGSLSAAGPITVELGIPAEASLNSATGTGWNCVGTTCTAAGPAAPFAQMDPITVDVAVDPGAPDIITASATVTCSCPDARPANDFVEQDLDVRDPPPADADFVEFEVSGATQYALSDFAYLGDLSIGHSGGQLSSLTGSVTIPSPTGVGDAELSFNVQKDTLTSLVTGSVTIHDDEAGVHLNTPMFGGSLNSVAFDVVSGAKNWINFSRWPWRSYRISFEVTDNGL